MRSHALTWGHWLTGSNLAVHRILGMNWSYLTLTTTTSWVINMDYKKRFFFLGCGPRHGRPSPTAPLSNYVVSSLDDIPDCRRRQGGGRSPT